jgi:hypothetical protein
MSDDGFKPAEDVKGGPIPTTEVIANIEANGTNGVPVFSKLKSHGGTLIFVAGGPSLLKTLPELKKRHEAGEFILTSNNTHDYLIENGIMPNACILIDPRESVKDCVQNPQKCVKYYVASVCNPGVFKNLEGYDVTKILVAYGLDDESDIKAHKRLYDNPGHDYVVGGTMTPLRAMPFTVMLGYARMEFYGFDSCYTDQQPPVIYSDDPRFAEALKKSEGLQYQDEDSPRTYVVDEAAEGGFFYAYKKFRAEAIQVAKTPDGREFLTSPGFAHQAKQFIKWVDRLEGRLDVVVHGDSLNRHWLEIHRKQQERIRAAIGDRRWTDEYAQMQRQLHEQGGYGLWGDHENETIGRGILSLYDQLKRPITVMDYGAGSGALGKSLTDLFRPVSVTNYDPFHPRWRDNPEPGVHDIVTCFDVLEHVEEQCVENTLKYIAAKARYVAVFSVALEEAGKTLPDGRNAHITLRSAQWWHKKVSQYFVVVEAVVDENSVYLACQKPDATEKIASEKGSANSVAVAA